ncbi:hypothetical protein IAU60_001501 [Kwoniella sp. DSM 27419]
MQRTHHSDLAHANKPLNFLQKLYDFLALDPHPFPDVIYWASDSKQLVIAQPDRLAKEVLPKLFKHDKVSSFGRQLNIYGFSRLFPGRQFKDLDGRLSEASVWAHPTLHRLSTAKEIAAIRRRAPPKLVRTRRLANGQIVRSRAGQGVIERAMQVKKAMMKGRDESWGRAIAGGASAVHSANGAVEPGNGCVTDSPSWSPGQQSTISPWISAFGDAPASAAHAHYQQHQYQYRLEDQHRNKAEIATSSPLPVLVSSLDSIPAPATSTRWEWPTFNPQVLTPATFACRPYTSCPSSIHTSPEPHFLGTPLRSTESGHHPGTPAACTELQSQSLSSASSGWYQPSTHKVAAPAASIPSNLLPTYGQPSPVSGMDPQSMPAAVHTYGDQRGMLSHAHNQDSPAVWILATPTHMSVPHPVHTSMEPTSVHAAPGQHHMLPTQASYTPPYLHRQHNGPANQEHMSPFSFEPQSAREQDTIDPKWISRVLSGWTAPSVPRAVSPRTQASSPLTLEILTDLATDKTTHPVDPFAGPASLTLPGWAETPPTDSAAPIYPPSSLYHPTHTPHPARLDQASHGNGPCHGVYTPSPSHDTHRLALGTSLLGTPPSTDTPSTGEMESYAHTPGENAMATITLGTPALLPTPAPYHHAPTENV